MQGRTRRAVLQASAALVAGLAGCVGPSDREGTPSGDGGTTPDDPVRWRYDVAAAQPDDDAADSCHNCVGLRHSPTVVDGTVYVGGGRLAALDSADGSERWTLQTGAPALASPLVRGDAVVAACGYAGGLDNDGERLVCAAAASGDERWRVDDLDLSSVVAATADAVYVAGGDDQVSPRGADTNAVGAADGERRWRRETGEVLSPGVATEDAVFLGAPDAVLALDAATGDERWRVPAGGSADVALAGETLFADVGRGLSALDPATGDERWRYEPPGGFVTAWSADPERVLVGTYDGGVASLDAATGEQRWRAGAGEQVWTLAADARTAYVGLSRGPRTADVFAYDASTGDERWRYANDGGSGVNALAVGDGVYARFSGSDELVALDPGDGAERWRVAPSGRLTAPVVADGAVYVGTDEGTLLALDDG